MRGSAAIITGVSGGIGRGLARSFAQAGYTVVGVDRVPTHEAGMVFVESDLDRLCTDTEYRARSFSALLDALGGKPLRVLVNNAAIQVIRPVSDLSINDWSSCINVNLVAPFLLSQALLAELEKAQGSVVNIASVHARLTKPGFVAYATTKSALLGLTRSMSVELGGRVRVNAICPGAVATPLLEEGFRQDPDAYRRLAEYHPFGRVGTPEEIANLALYLASEASAFVTGAAIETDGAIGSRLHDPS